ncbi:hypothetical protein C8J57DRAFT_1573613 [Mycena rebaudengoi]|nr:hypothetical protein C8J57DRAFT_1573613 [Mycena rebaudengoi]
MDGSMVSLLRNGVVPTRAGGYRMQRTRRAPWEDVEADIVERRRGVPWFAQKAVENLTAIALEAHPSSRGTVRLTGPHPQNPLDIQKMHFQAAGGAADVQALVDYGLTRFQNLEENSLIDEEEFPGSILTLYSITTSVCGAWIGSGLLTLSFWPKVPGYFAAMPMYMMSEKAADTITNNRRRSYSFARVIVNIQL